VSFPGWIWKQRFSNRLDSEEELMSHSDHARTEKITSTEIIGLIAATALMLLLLSYTHLRLQDYAHDDAYIHFRIASNLVDYGVPYFNPGEPVKASSSSGWTLLLSGVLWLSRLFGSATDLRTLAAIINSVMTTCGALIYTLLLVRLSEGHQRFFIFYLGFLVSYVSLTIPPSIGLMETATALVIAGVAFHLLLSDSKYCLLLFSASVFFRPELVILLVLVLFYVIVRRRFSYKDTFLFSLLGALPFLIYDYFFFGTVLPNAVKTKAVVYSLSYRDTLLTILSRLLDDLPLSSACEFCVSYEVAFAYVVFLLGLVGAHIGIFTFREVRCLGRCSADQRSYVSGLIMLWGICVLGSYVATKTYIFPWYEPLYVVPILIVIGKTLLGTRSPFAPLGLVVFAIPMLAQMLGLSQVLSAASGNPTCYQDFEAGARVRQYIQIGSRLFDQYPHATLMTSEVGGLGYGFKGHIVDGVGLISPGALRYHPMSVPEERSAGNIGAIPVGFIEEMNPELIVSYDIFAEAFLKSDALDHYVRIKYRVFVEEDISRSDIKTLWGSEYLNVFIRKDLAPAS